MLRCELCRKPLDPTLKHPHPLSMSGDHIRQQHRGGSHRRSNLRFAHLICNMTRKRGRRRTRPNRPLEGYTLAKQGQSFRYYTPTDETLL